MSDANEDRNARVQQRYDELMAEGKHGHYETLFRVVKEETDAVRTEEKGIRDAANFLLDRLSEFGNDTYTLDDEAIRLWYGHVEPAIARLQDACGGVK